MLANALICMSIELGRVELIDKADHGGAIRAAVGKTGSRHHNHRNIEHGRSELGFPAMGTLGMPLNYLFLPRLGRIIDARSNNTLPATSALSGVIVGTNRNG